MISLAKNLVKRLPPIKALFQERDELKVRLAAVEAQLQGRSAADSPRPCYDHDGMRLSGKNTAFLSEDAFLRAYQAGVNTGHKFGPTPEIHIEWRVHIACWAARHALHLPGDFVECGVNTGIFSLAVCHYVDLNATGKSFFLFDTYNGIPEEQMLPTERTDRTRHNEEFYPECYELARRNFAPFPRAHLVRGMVPDSLTTVDIDKVCYLSLDMNIAVPEVAAMEFFWEKLVPGAVVVLDDYGFQDYCEQQKALDEFALRKGVSIATLPTGQGLLLKP
jgi:O-methyltransferase